MKRLLRQFIRLRPEHRLEILRYIILGASDGVLFALGILLVTLGFSAGDAFKAWIGGTLTAALTNSYGAYFAERSLEEAKLYALEKHLLRDLKETLLFEKRLSKVKIRVLAAGLSTITGGLLPAVFFFLLSYPINAITGIIVALLTLSTTGYFSAERDKVKTALLYTGGGILVALLAYLIGQIV